MSFSQEQIEQLSANLSPRYVKQNQDGMAYIEAWVCIHRANTIFGFAGWSSETTRIEIVDKSSYQKNGKDMWEVTCFATVRVTAGTVAHEGVGTGSGFGARISAAIDSSVKEAESDALKRALRQFGNQFGNALYDKEKRFVGEDAVKPQKFPAEQLSARILEARDQIAATETLQEVDAFGKQNANWISSLPARDRSALQLAIKAQREALAVQAGA